MHSNDLNKTMLQNSFFFIEELTNQPKAVDAVVRIEPTHSIFDGHFPGQPVVPGVCMVQMVKEVVQNATGKNLLLHTAANMKFLTVIDPRVNPIIQINISVEPDEVFVKINATLFAGEVTFFKLKAAFAIQ